MHLGLDAAPAVVTTPVSPDGAAEVFRSSQGLVSGHRTRGDGLPRLGVFAGWDDGMGAAVSDGIVAFASIIGAVCGDAADRLVRRDLVQKIWQHRRITDVAPGDLHGPNLQRLFVDPKMYLAPNPPLGPTHACVRSTLLHPRP